jgi:hypothetical protein
VFDGEEDDEDDCQVVVCVSSIARKIDIQDGRQGKSLKESKIAFYQNIFEYISIQE